MHAVSHSARRVRLRSLFSGFAPIYFSMVMATGIVSIAVHLHGFALIASVLLWLNVALYLGCLVLLAGRLLDAPASLLGELADFRRGPAFFTIIAGTSVVARQLAILNADIRIARVMLAIAVPLWAALIYAIFTAFTVKTEKPSLAEGIHGGWLLAVVATQAISVLATLVAKSAPTLQQPALLFVSLGFWLAGGMLYIWIISLIFYRYLFFRFVPSDLMPPYWINMGAMAISTLAGVSLVQSAPLAPFLQEILPFLKGFTLFFWATATWWIPMLVILGAWRHIYKRFALKYDVLYWGIVFPLGMYSVCTVQLSQAFGLPFLAWLSRTFAYASIGAWLLTFAGFLFHSAEVARRG